MQRMTVKGEHRIGGFFALGAYAYWGFIPLYYPLIAEVSPYEMMAHRVLWTGVALVPVLFALGFLDGVLDVVRNPRTLLMLVTSAFLIGLNWLVFMWAMTHEQVIQTSMGYFINPLLNVVLGVVFLRERLRRAQTMSVVLAATGVAILVYSVGSLPWVALLLPTFFGFYGLVRKHVTVDTFTALFVEIIVLSPFALGYWVYIGQRGDSAFFSGDSAVRLWLILLGPISIIPLTLFGAAAKRITLTSLGFFQYIAPSISFIIGAFFFREPFSGTQLVTFIFIWVSLVIFATDAAVFARRRNA